MSTNEILPSICSLYYACLTCVGLNIDLVSSKSENYSRMSACMSPILTDFESELISAN